MEKEVVLVAWGLNTPRQIGHNSCTRMTVIGPFAVRYTGHKIWKKIIGSLQLLSDATVPRLADGTPMTSPRMIADWKTAVAEACQ